MKKVLLTSAAVLALFAAAAPAVADINGGANTPGAYDQPTTGGGVNDAYNAQTEFENARKVNEYLAGHQEDIDAEAAQDPAVVAAKSEFDAVEGGSHLYTEKKEAYESALNTARNNVRNRYTEELQKKWNTASKKEGNYYILNETPEQKNARYEAEHGAKSARSKSCSPRKTAPSQEDVKKAQTSAEKAKKAEEKSKAVKENKSGSKAEAKALPNTAAVK